MDKVIYRKFKEGDIIALFPQIADKVNGWSCVSYMHTGQHSGANPDIVYSTKLATPEEYAELHAELEKIGYNPKPAKRFTQKDYGIRKAQYKN